MSGGWLGWPPLSIMPKANTKNRIIKKQQKTSAVVHDVPYQYADGEIGNISVHIPDNEYAYGSSEKTMQLITEDIVGKHSQNNAQAIAAGESARMQVAQRASYERAVQAVLAKTRAVKAKEHRDSNGSLIGVSINVSKQEPSTGLWSISGYYYPAR